MQVLRLREAKFYEIMETTNKAEEKSRTSSANLEIAPTDFDFDREVGCCVLAGGVTFLETNAFRAHSSLPTHY